MRYDKWWYVILVAVIVINAIWSGYNWYIDYSYKQAIIKTFEK